GVGRGFARLGGADVGRRHRADRGIVGADRDHAPLGQPVAGVVRQPRLVLVVGAGAARHPAGAHEDDVPLGRFHALGLGDRGELGGGDRVAGVEVGLAPVAGDVEEQASGNEALDLVDAAAGGAEAADGAAAVAVVELAL